MTHREPSWWYASEPRWQAQLLSPAALIYGAAAIARFRLTTPVRVAHPVICIGNFTSGGAGKTPLTLAIAEMVRGLGHEPWALSRGYGGALPGPVRVNVALHTARAVGDEPMLLAKAMPTVVARDRAAGAVYIAQSAPANAVILMDDGLQNPLLAKDLTIAVVDRARGLGNGRVIPAGPLRAPIAFQAPLADVLIINGAPASAKSPSIAAVSRLTAAPVFEARPIAVAAAEQWRGQRVIAFAGIANPERFFALLESLGAEIIARRAFADHEPLSDADAANLLHAAHRNNAQLMTTEKDAARLKGATGVRADLAAAIAALAIKIEFANGDRARLFELIAGVIAAKTNAA